MRLTLRTLLSYLDDTLDPAQTKQIGQKVADSDQARELAERIKQVTRRRRLTTPPTTGPGGMDPNTIAEYLDNEVTPEKSAEVEQICLASDVHLAEVASCHQILTLVLGEPALVPPSAKQRMYALVKGPESIPFRKPAKQAARADQDLSSELEPDDGDDTLRLGAPSVGKNQRNLLFIGGGGLLAVCFLGLAIWMLVGRGNNPNVVDPKKDGNEIAQNNDKKDQDKDKSKDDAKKDKDKAEWVPPPTPTKDKDGASKDDGGLPNIKVIPVEVKPEKQAVEIAYAPASAKQATIGQYVQPPAKYPSVLLQLKSEKAGWTRTDKDVSSGRSLLSLPGSVNVVNLGSGVELTLWGNLVELTRNPVLSESRATVHANDSLDADLTLERGRIVLRNTKPGGKDAIARVRFQNPTLNEEEYFDIVLSPESAVILERYIDLNREEPFYDDPKDKARLGPTATIVAHAYEKSAHIRCKQVSSILDENQVPTLQWNSRSGELAAPQARSTFPPPKLELEVLKDKAEQQARDRAIKGAVDLVQILQKKETDVALAEYMQTIQKAAERESVASKDRLMAQDTYYRWIHAIRCYSALDDVSFLFGEFSADPTPPIIRGVYMLTLQKWIALDRDNDYKLLDVVRKNYRKQESYNIMHLFHLISSERAVKPETYDNLIENLNNDLMPIRALSYWHLAGLVPEGRKILYDPSAPPQIRQKAAKEWHALIPPGKLPPSGAQLKKDSGKDKK